MAKNNKDKFISKAQTFIKRGKFDSAIKEYQNALEIDKKDIRVLQKLGELYSRKNQKEEAINYLSKAAQFLYKDGFYSKAVALYSQILKIDEDQIEAVKSLGDCYMKLGLNAQAMAQFKKIATQYEREGKLQEALDITQNMLDMDPRNHVLATKLAELNYKLGKKDEGYQAFMRALDQLHEDGHYEQYVKLREKLIKIDPENMENLKELAPIYIDHEQWDKAYAVLTRIYKNDPEELEYLGQLAKAALKVGRPEESANTWKEVARIYKARGLRQKAKDSLRRVLEIKPDDPEALAVVGREEHVLEDEEPQEMEEIIEEPLEVLEEDEEEEAAAAPDEEVVIDAGAPLESEGEEESADLSGSEIMEHLTEAGVYLKYGLKDKSLTHIKKVLNYDPQNIKARQLLKDIHIESGETSQAIKELEKIAGLANSEGDTETAQKTVREWLNLDPENLKAKEMMAEIEIASGKETQEVSAAEIVAEEEEDQQPSEAEEEISLEDEYGEASLEEEDEGAVAVEAEDELAEADDLEEEEVMEEEEAVPLTEEVSMAPEPADERSDEAVAVEEEEEPALPEDDEASEPDFVEVSMEEEKPAQPAAETASEPQPSPAQAAIVEEEEPELPGKEEAPEPAPVEIPEEAPAKSEEKTPEPAAQDLSEELDEAEFYLQHGLQDEAKKLYASILEKDPANQVALKKLEELEEPAEEAEEVVISEEDASVGFMDEPATQAEGPPPPEQKPQESAQAPPVPGPPPPPAQEPVNELEPESEPIVPEPPPEVAEPEPPQAQTVQAPSPSEPPPMTEEVATEPEAVGAEAELEAEAEIEAEPEVAEAEIDSEAGPEPAEEELEAEAEIEAEPEVAEAEIDSEASPEPNVAEMGPDPEGLGESSLSEEEEQPARPEIAVPPPPEPPSRPAPPPPVEEGFDLKQEVAGEVEQDEKFFFEPSAPPESDLFSSEGEDEELFDLAAELEKDDEIFPEASGYGMGSTSEEFSFEATLSAFKKGVAQTISEQDSATHFDLAIAYREMGLYDEAIQSFFTASGDPSKYSECMLLAAMIFREKGDVDKAVQTVTSALGAENAREQDKSALYAELGKALKDKGENGKALWAFQKTKELDPQLPEIDDLIAQLEGATPEPVSLEQKGPQAPAQEVATPPVDTGPPPTRDKTSWESAALDESSQPRNQEADTEDESKKKKRKKISYV